MSTRIEKQQLAVFKAIDETIALYQQGITECHDIINQPDINHTRLMDILTLLDLYSGICLAMANKTGAKFIDICRLYEYRPKWDSTPRTFKHQMIGSNDLYGYWLSPPSYYYTDEKNL